MGGDKEKQPLSLQPDWYLDRQLPGDGGFGDESSWITTSDFDRILNPTKPELPPEELALSPIMVGIAEPT